LTYGRKLYERRIVGSELVVTCRDASAVFDLVEEPFDQIPGSIEMRAKADQTVAIAVR
jgi:hypothetical protein